MADYRWGKINAPDLVVDEYGWVWILSLPDEFTYWAKGSSPIPYSRWAGDADTVIQLRDDKLEIAVRADQFAAYVTRGTETQIRQQIRTSQSDYFCVKDIVIDPVPAGSDLNNLVGSYGPLPPSVYQILRPFEMRGPLAAESLNHEVGGSVLSDDGTSATAFDEIRRMQAQTRAYEELAREHNRVRAGAIARAVAHGPVTVKVEGVPVTYTVVPAELPSGSAPQTGSRWHPYGWVPGWALMRVAVGRPGAEHMVAAGIGSDVAEMGTTVRFRGVNYDTRLTVGNAPIRWSVVEAVFGERVSSLIGKADMRTRALFAHRIAMEGSEQGALPINNTSIQLTDELTALEGQYCQTMGTPSSGETEFGALIEKLEQLDRTVEMVGVQIIELASRVAAELRDGIVSAGRIGTDENASGGYHVDILPARYVPGVRLGEKYLIPLLGEVIVQLPVVLLGDKAVEAAPMWVGNHRLIKGWKPDADRAARFLSELPFIIHELKLDSARRQQAAAEWIGL